MTYATNDQAIAAWHMLASTRNDKRRLDRKRYRAWKVGRRWAGAAKRAMQNAQYT